MDSTMVNLAICGAAMFVCICRMGAMQGSKTKKTIRYQYTMWLVTMFVSGFSFALFGERATPMQTLLSLAVLTHLLIGFKVWRHGPPPYTSSHESFKSGEQIKVHV